MYKHDLFKNTTSIHVFKNKIRDRKSNYFLLYLSKKTSNKETVCITYLQYEIWGKQERIKGSNILLLTDYQKRRMSFNLQIRFVEKRSI